MILNTIQFGENTVTKISTPERMTIEIEKTIRAYNIGKNSGLFLVPKIIEYDKSKGVAVFERIHNLSPIRDFLLSAKMYDSIIEQAGYALAIIHRDLILPDEMKIWLPSELNFPGTDVFFHGDFNGINVCVAPESSSLVILDWQMTSRHGGQATYGTRFFDLVWFINNLLYPPTFKFLYNNSINHIAKVFLKSYFDKSEYSLNMEILLKYFNNFFDTKLPYRKMQTDLRRQYLLPRSNVLVKRLINSLK